MGAAEHEADDVIGALATAADSPVDIVTGDRDLFQLIDDARGIRIVYTARGMSNLEIVDDAAVVSRYGVRAAQYADFAVLRGDPSDGLPGVAGIGEKSAASLLSAHGSLDGIRAAAAQGTGAPRPSAPRSPPPRTTSTSLPPSSVSPAISPSPRSTIAWVMSTSTPQRRSPRSGTSARR